MSPLDVAIYSVQVVGAFFRLVATFSSRTALTRLVLYVWANELAFKVLVIVSVVSGFGGTHTRSMCENRCRHYTINEGNAAALWLVCGEWSWVEGDPEQDERSG